MMHALLRKMYLLIQIKSIYQTRNIFKMFIQFFLLLLIEMFCLGSTKTIPAYVLINTDGAVISDLIYSIYSFSQIICNTEQFPFTHNVLLKKITCSLKPDIP